MGGVNCKPIGSPYDSALNPELSAAKELSTLNDLQQSARLSQAGNRSSTLEKMFLILLIVSLPLEAHILVIPGFSIQFIMFGVVAFGLVLTHPWTLLRTMSQPVFLAAFGLFGFGLAMEATSNYSSYVELMRIGQMIIGAMLIAAICRDELALTIAMYGYLLAGIWLAVLLFFTSYGAIQGATATNFDEASVLRNEAFADNPIQANLNGMAFSAGQGAVVALAYALRAPSVLSRNGFIGAGLLCMIASFLPLSRGGVVITLVSCASVMYAFGLRQAKVLLLAVILGTALLAWVPQSIWSRMSFTFEEREGKVEGRARVYGAAIDHMPEYFLTGVGAGNFWSVWGRRSQFGTQGHIAGAHNSFLQVSLYWGIGGLIALLIVFWQAYLCLPQYSNREAASLALLGISVSLLLYSMVTHNIYAKDFCLGLGLLGGARSWIWPHGIVKAHNP